MTSIKRYTVFFIIIFASSILLAQMPDWKYFRDREGNRYYFDQGGKIRITGKISYRYKPVTPLGIDYYLNYGLELIKEDHLAEGLTILKSILSMRVKNNRIFSAQAKAADTINKLKKRHGNRFERIDKAAQVLLIKNKNDIDILNDRMFYYIKVPAKVSVIHKKEREKLGYSYSGLLLGLEKVDNKSDDGGKVKYDMLLGIDCESFSIRVKDVQAAEKKWKHNLGYAGLERKEIDKTRNSILYRFKSIKDSKYSGFEGIYINSNIIYCVRIISSGKSFSVNSAIMEKIISSFKIVSKTVQTF